jgi:hypothetical protein
MPKIRRLGDILLEIEPLLLEMADHELQHGDILNLINGYLEVHCPDSKEVYIDGTKPVFYYGPTKEEPNGHQRSHRKIKKRS